MRVSNYTYIPANQYYKIHSHGQHIIPEKWKYCDGREAFPKNYNYLALVTTT